MIIGAHLHSAVNTTSASVMPNENKSTFSVYGLRPDTSGAMYTWLPISDLAFDFEVEMPTSPILNTMSPSSSHTRMLDGWNTKKVEGACVHTQHRPREQSP